MADTIDPIFLVLSNDSFQEALNLPLDEECLLYRRRKIEPPQNSMEEIRFEQIPILLQLRRDFVLQLHPVHKFVISGFQCELSITFKVLRSTVVEIDEVGQTIGIEFRSQQFPRKPLYLYIPEENKSETTEKVQKMAIKLGRKFILQDGFHEIYRAVKKIGKGVTASVYKALRLTDRKQFAVKAFKKDVYYSLDNGRGKAAFEIEFKAMTEVESRYICRLISVFESDNSIYIVMDLLTRSLYCYLKMHGLPTLMSCKEMMVKLLMGLNDLHQKGIMHRDLKLQNIMILQTQIIQPVIIDLGLAQLSTHSQFLYTKCGTPGYVAPQILNLKPNELASPPYNHLCDIFSMGVIFYILLAGKTLFEGGDQREVVRKNRQCEIDYEFKSDPKFNDEVRDLLGKMLKKDPAERSTAQNLLDHQFFKEVPIIKEYRTRNSNTLMEYVEEKPGQEICSPSP